MQCRRDVHHGLPWSSLLLQKIQHAGAAGKKKEGGGQGYARPHIRVPQYIVFIHKRPFELEAGKLAVIFTKRAPVGATLHVRSMLGGYFARVWLFPMRLDPSGLLRAGRS